MADALNIEVALEHHVAGRLAEAEQIYRAILGREPNNAEALNYLGVLAGQTGHADIAVTLLSRAIAINPLAAEYHSNLGVVHRGLGRYAQALGCFERALQLRPEYFEAFMNLGTVLVSLDRLPEALEAFGRAVTLQPQNSQAHYNIGLVLMSLERFDEAVEEYSQAVRWRPDFTEGHRRLGLALRRAGWPEQAAVELREAIALDPKCVEAHNELAAALCDLNRRDEAIEEFQKAVAKNPNFSQAHYNLGLTLAELGRLDEAEATYRKAIALEPEFVEAIGNLGNVHKWQGRIDLATAEYRRALALRPNTTMVHSNLVYAACFDPQMDASGLLEMNRQWARQQAASIPRYEHRRRNHDRLKIGYISPDFCEHVIGRNLVPLFENHDHGQFEIICYSDVRREDFLTRRLRAGADVWRTIHGRSDVDVAEQIRADEIDILVDLTLHLSHNRLLVMARKPAPIQATFAGYPGGTGLDAIDYRLTDPYLDAPGVDAFYVEKSLRLGHSFWCYQSDEEPEIGPPPASTRGHVTFGCLNNFCKINPAVIELWKRVLDRISGSRLLLLTSPGSHRNCVFEKLDGRVEFSDWLAHGQYLEVYRNIDIGLDTFPYNGHTTSLDSIWMGVPVVSLIGQTVVGRAGFSQSSNLGMPELAVKSPDDYVGLAVSLASDLSRLAHLRSTLREKMKSSPLMDAAGFARDIEAAYRQMWKSWIDPH